MRGKVQKIPISQALVRPDLWFGCDRNGLTLVGTLSALVGIGGGIGFGEWWLALLGGALFWAGRELLRKAAKADPLQLKILWRTLSEKPVYDARARWDKPDLTPRNWR